MTSRKLFSRHNKVQKTVTACTSQGHAQARGKLQPDKSQPGRAGKVSVKSHPWLRSSWKGTASFLQSIVLKPWLVCVHSYLGTPVLALGSFLCIADSFVFPQSRTRGYLHIQG